MSDDNATAVHAPQLAGEWRIGTYEWRPGDDRLIWSPELLRIYGRERAPASEQEFSAHVHPEDRLRVQAETSAFLGSNALGYSHTFRIVRPDGAVRIILDRGAITRDARGTVERIQGVNVDVTDEAHLNYSTASRLQATEGRYRALFDAIDQGFCVLEVRLDGTDGRIDYRVIEANPAFFDRTGFPADIIGRWLREAAPQLEEHWYQTYGGVARTGRSVRFEQGSEMLGRWFDVYAFRLDAAEERRVGVLFSDITARKRQEEHAQLLVSEVSHRSKNLLSLVQAIARQTSRSGADDFFERFCERIVALATEQDLLVQNAWKTVPLPDLTRSQLAHFSDLLGTRIAIAGPPLSLTPDAAQALGMALHELTTNAAKYGALSNADGRIAINWSVETDALAGTRFAMSWAERSGPPASEPQHRGFGSKVTKEMVEASTGGEVTLTYESIGLTWHLTCPADKVLSETR